MKSDATTIAHQIIITLLNLSRPKTRYQLATALDMSDNATYRLLKTLVACGWVEEAGMQGRSKLYRSAVNIVRR